MTGMDDLTTWLRAQLDADEFLFRHWPGDPTTMRGYDGRGGAVASWSPQLALAEVAAKRRILDLHHQTELESEPDHEPMGAGCAECGHFDWPCETIRLLALPYAGRDGYREEWRP